MYIKAGLRPTFFSELETRNTGHSSLKGREDMRMAFQQPGKRRRRRHEEEWRDLRATDLPQPLTPEKPPPLPRQVKLGNAASSGKQWILGDRKT